METAVCLERPPDLEPDSLTDNYKTIPENQFGDWDKKNQKKAELQQMYLSELKRQSFSFLLLTSSKDDQHI